MGGASTVLFLYLATLSSTVDLAESTNWDKVCRLCVFGSNKRVPSIPQWSCNHCSVSFSHTSLYFLHAHSRQVYNRDLCCALWPDALKHAFSDVRERISERHRDFRVNSFSKSFYWESYITLLSNGIISFRDATWIQLYLRSLITQFSYCESENSFR